MADKAGSKLTEERTQNNTEESPSEDPSTPSQIKKDGGFTKSSFALGEKRKPDATGSAPMKLGFKSNAKFGISIKLGAPEAKKKKAESVVQQKQGSVAAAFGDGESDNEEEMPPEAKMRMKNVGRDTPTSAGPNSFNKGKKGFSHERKILEKELKQVKPSH